MSAITLEAAQKVLTAGLRKAEEISSPSSITIVDEGRELLAFARQPDALLASIEISISKAYTARSMNMNTGEIGPMTQPGQPLFGLENTHRRALVTFAGGRPLRVGEEIVGAVGVAGGTVDQDDEVAAAAAAAMPQA
jgi:uncharacterized protein GlcG (DUF336 family)